MALSVESQSKQISLATDTSRNDARRLSAATKKPSVWEGFEKQRRAPVYFALVARLNFEVNFSTRPAVSTRRFSPV